MEKPQSNYSLAFPIFTNSIIRAVIIPNRSIEAPDFIMYKADLYTDGATSPLMYRTSIIIKPILEHNIDDQIPALINDAEN